MLKKRIQKYYNTIIVEDLLIVYNYGNIMQLPCLTHATLNTSSKNFLFNKKIVIYALTAFFLLSGQKGILTRAHKSIATFNLREGNLIGCKVSLRRGVMFNLINKCITFILPRVESFSKGQILPANGKKGVVHIGVDNFLLLPEIETFFSTYGLAAEFSSGHAIRGFDIICHFSIPKVQVPISVFTHFKKYVRHLIVSEKENNVNELIAFSQDTFSPISIANLLVTTFQFPNPQPPSRMLLPINLQKSLFS